MNKVSITSIFIGIVIGFILAVSLLNRYEPMTVNGVSARLDKLTGEACVFVTTGMPKREVIALFGVPPCQ